MQKITPFLWFDNNAEEAVNFYVSVFKNSKIGSIIRYDEAGAQVSGRPKGSVMTAAFQLDGQEFTALNGGPIFKFTPAISFFVYCKTEKEINELFAKLSTGGQVRMALDKYPFSERYAFISDKYGVSWQLILGDSAQKIIPCLLFVGKQLEKTEEAIKFYTNIFKKSVIKNIQKYDAGEQGLKGSIKYSLFSLEGQDFTAMSGAGQHQFTFTEATSFVVNCKTQQEVDHYWEKLSKDGTEVQCGWLKDKFGISWQVVPTILVELLQDKNTKKAQRVMQAMLQMVKIDIKTLKQAYDQE